MNAPPETSILIVDDDDGGRYVKAHTLARQGYRVREAALAQTAIELVAKEPPDLVLLDVRLPDGNGVEVCRQIKSGFPQVAILQTSSALITAQDRAQALEAGADSYLVEPIEPDELVAIIRSLLRLRRAEQSLRQMNENLEARVVERTGELAETQRMLVSERAGRREAESVLWHAQKLEAVGRLTGGIAHDFNNLLTVISGNLELLQSAVNGERERSPGAQLSLISSALRAAEHGAHMTQQLLAFARRGVLQSKTVNLNTIIAGMADFMRRTLGETIKLDVIEKSTLWNCHIDPVQLEAAILNLAINARDAMPEGGTLKIALSNVDTRKGGSEEEITPGRYVCIQIADTGAGMTEDVLERAFEPFFTTKSIGEGSGLGLSQVYGFVNQSGGDVKIRSCPGVGTAVSLYLPRCDGETAENAQSAAAANSHPAGSETILVVEDEELVRDVAVEMIRELGYKVLAASDGNEALQVLQGIASIDLLFTDVLMPGGVSGVALARKARQIRQGLKVLLTSGYPATEGSQMGAPGFPMIQKPYQRDKLSLMLRAALD
ncbi:MAG TPA: response regulator [Stellaceae bacterium]|nr:response regulator [Stellaceae bacterium]